MMMKKRYLYLTALVCFILPAADLMAGQSDPFIGPDGRENFSDPKNIENAAENWKEGKTELPPFPKDGDLLEFHVDVPDSRFTYYIDESSLAISTDDYVIRYTLVIESERGTRNIFYEGMRCSTMEYKTYAFGSRKNNWRPVRKPSWKPIKYTRHMRYRLDLNERYFCSRKSLLNMESIVHSLKNPDVERVTFIGD